MRQQVTGYLPALLAAGIVGEQILWPVTHGSLHAALTVAVVLTFAALCIAHVALTRGVQQALVLLACTAVPGFCAELVGVRTGVPFGSYSYSTVLGVRVMGVPVVVALAWTMLAWPAMVVARRLVAGRAARIAVAAWAMTAGDLFLDPQMVRSGAWTWHSVGAHLPGVPQVPLSNFAGWLLVSVVLSAIVERATTASNRPTDDAVLVAVFVWFWIAWTAALALLMHLPAAAGWGFVAMGTVAVPAAVHELAALRARFAAGRGAAHAAPAGLPVPVRGKA